MFPDFIEVSTITGDDRRADIFGGERDQNIERHFPQLLKVVSRSPSQAVKYFGGFKPVTFCRRDDFYFSSELGDKPTLRLRPRPSPKLMEHDRRAANDPWSAEEFQGETTGAEVFDVDRGVE